MPAASAVGRPACREAAPSARAHVGADELAAVGQRNPDVLGAERDRAGRAREGRRPSHRQAAAWSLIWPSAELVVDAEAAPVLAELLGIIGERRDQHPRQRDRTISERPNQASATSAARSGAALRPGGSTVVRSPSGQAASTDPRPAGSPPRAARSVSRPASSVVDRGRHDLRRVRPGLRRCGDPLGGVEGSCRLSQCGRELAGGAEPIFRALGHRLGDDRVELLGNLGASSAPTESGRARARRSSRRSFGRS